MYRDEGGLPLLSVATSSGYKGSTLYNARPFDYITHHSPNAGRLTVQAKITKCTDQTVQP
jgi:hypothetical protein